MRVKPLKSKERVEKNVEPNKHSIVTSHTCLAQIESKVEGVLVELSYQIT